VGLLDDLRGKLAPVLPDILPTEARAVSLEVISWLVTVHVFLTEARGMDRWEDLDARLVPLVREYLPENQTWDVVVTAHRKDRPEPIEVIGSLLWAESSALGIGFDDPESNRDTARPAT
jgi:hypothetical protein